MYQGSNYASPEHHRAFVRALVRRAEELERRAAISAADHIRRAESLRAASIGHDSLVEAVDTLIEAVEQMHVAAEHLHHAIVRVVNEEPQATRWQRRRVRRMLNKAIRLLERGVVDLENHR
jgi:hypothetical protein